MQRDPGSNKERGTSGQSGNFFSPKVASGARSRWRGSKGRGRGRREAGWNPHAVQTLADSHILIRRRGSPEVVDQLAC